MRGFHNSFLAGNFRSVAASAAASAGGAGGAGHSWVEAGRFRGASVVREAERRARPERDSFSSASELPAAELSAGGHYGAESGQSSLCETHDAAADRGGASLVTALLAAAALSIDGYYEDETPLGLERAAEGPVGAGWPDFAAAQSLKAGTRTELQSALRLGPQNCY